MNLIHNDNNSVEIEIGFVRGIRLISRIISVFFGVIIVTSLIAEGINIISLLLVFVPILLYPFMTANGTIVITAKKILERKRIWRNTTEVSTDISHYDEVKVVRQITSSDGNGGRSKIYLTLILKKEGSSDIYNSFSNSNPWLFENYLRCYDVKKEMNDFKKVISFLSTSNARKISYDEESLPWFKD